MHYPRMSGELNLNRSSGPHLQYLQCIIKWPVYQGLSYLVIGTLIEIVEQTLSGNSQQLVSTDQRVRPRKHQMLVNAYYETKKHVGE